MGDIAKLDDYRPHFRVQGGSADGASICEYVFSVRLAEDIATGAQPVSALPDAVWQTIMREWTRVTARGGEGSRD